jgi:SAM-dependent methyltransferase
MAGKEAAMNEQLEQERIARVYQQWSNGGALPRYAALRPEVLQQAAARARMFAGLFRKTIGVDIASLRVLDLGCGTGGFLRQLIDWGADPAKLCGTELLPERLDAARRNTASGVRWHLGGLESIDSGSFDLVTAHTVFSSILEDEQRRTLAAGMRRILRPGGWTLVFDVRYNNPRNPNLRKVTRAEALALWPGRQHHLRTLLLAPPLARAIARMPYLVSDTLAALLPPVRSHFVYMARKDP